MSYFEFPHTRTYDSDLGWLIDKMKEVLDNVDAQNAAIAMYKTWTEEHIAAVEQVAADLTEFVNTYFDNLDVQEEINNKIAAMAQDGSLLALIQPDIIDAVENWLSSSLTPTSPPVDSTLSISGAAADAKVTGDNITELKNDIAEYDAVINKGTMLININEWEQGAISSGQDTPNTNRVRCGFIGLENFDNNQMILHSGTYTVSTHFYSDENAESWIISSSSWLADGAVITIPTNAKYIRIAIRNATNGRIYPSDVAQNSIYFTGESKIYNAIIDVSNLNDFSDDTKRQLTAIEELHPFFKYYKDFEKRVLNTSETGAITLGSQNTDRWSIVVNLNYDTEITITNPLYLFRFYWWEGSILHHTAWGDTWTIPANVDVGITIKRRDSASFTDEEEPFYYIIPVDLYTQPKGYYKEEIEKTIEKVRKWNTEPGLVFLLSTDQHTMSVQGTLQKYDTITDTVVNMANVAKEFNIDSNISIGDLTDMKVPSAAAGEWYGITDLSYSNLDTIFRKWIFNNITKLKNVTQNFIYVMGNHDDNRYINRDNVQAAVSDYDFSMGEVYSYFISLSQNNRISNDSNNGLDYYIDYPVYKIRMFILDDNYYDAASNKWWYGYSDNTVTWFTNELQNVPVDYKIIILTHMSPINTHNEDTSDYQNISNIRQVITNFINNGGNVLAEFYGHTHADWATTYPWTDIAFAAGKCQNLSAPANLPDSVRPVRTGGTYTEDCWNVVIIQPENNVIKIVRFGAGTDKIYNSDILRIATNVTLDTELEGTITWSSRYDNAATVSNGIVTPVSGGTGGYTLITATDAEGNTENWVDYQ